MMGMELGILTLLKPLLEDSRLVPVQELVAGLQRVVLLDRQTAQRKDAEALPKMFAMRTEVNLRSGSILFHFENYIPAGKAKRKECLIQTFNEMSAAHFFD